MMWSPGRVASFSRGVWMVMVTDLGSVRIWRPEAVAFTMLEVSAFDLRRALGDVLEKGNSSMQRGAWMVARTSDVLMTHEKGRPGELTVHATVEDATQLRLGLGDALDAIHRHHGRPLAEFEEQLEKEHP